MPQQVLDLVAHIVHVIALHARITRLNQRRSQRMVIAPSNLMRRDGTFDFNQLVPGGNDGDFRRLRDAQSRMPARSSHGNFPSADARAGPHHHCTGAMITAAPMDRVPG